MIALATLSFAACVTALVCVNRARTPDGANYGMLLAGVGFVALLITGAVAWFG